MSHKLSWINTAQERKAYNRHDNIFCYTEMTRRKLCFSLEFNHFTSYFIKVMVVTEKKNTLQTKSISFFLRNHDGKIKIMIWDHRCQCCRQRRPSVRSVFFVRAIYVSRLRLNFTTRFHATKERLLSIKVVLPQ